MKQIFFIAQFLFLQCVYADLVEESEVLEEDAEDEQSDSEDVNNDEIGTDDNEISEDVEDDLEEVVPPSPQSEEQLKNFVLEQAEQSVEMPKTKEVEEPQKTSAEPAEDVSKELERSENQEVITTETEPAPVEQIETAGEKNIVEIKVAEPKIVKDQNIHVDPKVLAEGKYVENAIGITNVVLQVLDKKSTQCKRIKLELNKPVIVGDTRDDLSVVLKNAFMTPENMVPFSVLGYIEVHDPKDKNNKLLFSNWMCSTSTSGITFDHPLYDIKITNDKDI